MWKDISGKEKKPSLSQASINAKDYSIESHHTMNVCKVGGSFFLLDLFAFIVSNLPFVNQPTAKLLQLKQGNIF